MLCLCRSLRSSHCRPHAAPLLSQTWHRRRLTPPVALYFALYSTAHAHEKGASISDVHKNFGFFDPFPLVRIWKLFILKIHATSLTMSVFPLPPPMWTSYLEAPNNTTQVVCLNRLDECRAENLRRIFPNYGTRNLLRRKWSSRPTYCTLKHSISRLFRCRLRVLRLRPIEK